MHRPLQLGLGALAVLIGLALGAIIWQVWRTCADAVMPLDPLTSPACATVTSSGNTAWIGLLWPLALAVAAYAAYCALARGWGAAGVAIVIVLAITAAASMPLLEYFLFNAGPQSWDEPPGTGALTAVLFALSGAVLTATARKRVRV